jgi:hypothetical protein
LLLFIYLVFWLKVKKYIKDCEERSGEEEEGIGS